MAGEAELGRKMMALVGRCSGMTAGEAAAEVGAFLGEFADEDVESDPYESTGFDEDPRIRLRRRLFTPTRHRLEYNFGEMPVPSPAEAVAYESYQKKDRRDTARRVGVRLGRQGQGMTRGEIKDSQRKSVARAAKRRAARAGKIPQKSGA